ncbi:extracellular solute-binding protein [Paenibacillus agaridevorans]|uniref:extracellular solute-binding protein n=1 Tax=Paenibacillus agaridevorans TaxID=171404 RepID=UPI001BE447AF|nr:extracellular solute-binding protein [Paenibacillus agaridevorans]
MKAKKAKLVAICVLSLLLVIVSACSNSGSPSNGSPNNGNSGAVKNGDTGTDTGNKDDGEVIDPMGKIDPPVEITAIRPLDSTTKFAEGESIENNAWNRLYEQEFGIKLKYLWVADTSQYDQKFNVAMVSGKLADIMPVNAIQFQQLVDADQLEDLSEALEKYGTEKSKLLLEKDGGVGLDSATFGGKLLGLPLASSYTDNAPLLWVRTDWLEKLGLPEPKTMDDVLAIADAFVNQDPDDNGQKDTYGLGVEKLFYGAVPGLQGFFNSYHAYPEIWVKDDEGKLVYGSIQPEMKEALSKLQQMYKDGLIDREFGVKDAEKIFQAVNSGKMGMFYGLMYAPLLFQDGKTNDPNMDWKAFPLPSIDGEVAKPQTPFTVGRYYVVRKGVKNPEAAVKMLNAFHYGWEDKYPPTEITQDGDIEKWHYALVTGSNPTQNLDMYVKVTEGLEKNDTSGFDAPGQNVFYDSIVKFREGDMSGWGYTRVYDAQKLLYEYNQNNGYQMTEYIAGPTPTMVEKDSTLKKMELETFTKIVMGEASIDEFDDFVSDWKKLGGDVITEEVAAWQKSKNGN